jgi:NADP-dependent 3-hydroxy acid dehydrogenase YdfG
VLVTRRDVTDEGSMADALSVALERFGGIDVLINNAGFGAYGPLEVTAMEVIRRQFNTNVIGLLTVSKAVMPILRQRGGGVIVNISSIGGRMTFPLGSTYHGSQYAVEGLSEALVEVETQGAQTGGPTETEAHGNQGLLQREGRSRVQVAPRMQQSANPCALRIKPSAL